MSRRRTRHLADVVDQSPDDNTSVSSSRLPRSRPLPGNDPSLGVTGVVTYEPEQPIRLLVVDDDPRVRQAIALTIALEPDLVIVAEAADATTALALADGADPSVALVDLLVPEDVTGLALVRSLSERPHCAVVAMSIRGGLRDAALADGAVAFVEKSGDIDAVLDVVRAVAPRPHA